MDLVCTSWEKSDRSYPSTLMCMKVKVWLGLDRMCELSDLL